MERIELRDAWLGVLAPVAIAMLLVLVLLVLRQRRKGSTGLDPLFRRYDVAGWWRQRMATRMAVRMAARQRARVEREELQEERTIRRRALANMTAAARDARRERARIEQLEQEEADARVAAAEEARSAQAAAQEAERLSHKIVARDGTTVLLQASQYVRVKTSSAVHSGPLYDLSDEGLTVADWWKPETPHIPWEQIRAISVRHGRERQWWIPMTGGIVGGGLLGTCGWFLDELGRSTSGRAPDNPLTPYGLSIGLRVGGLLGMLIMYSIPGPRWRALIQLPADAPPLSMATLATRVTKSPTPMGGGAEVGYELIAQIVLVFVVLGTCAIFSR